MVQSDCSHWRRLLRTRNKQSGDTSKKALPWWTTSSIPAERKPDLSRYVLDASAVLALLNNEAGADAVQQLLPEAVISAVNLSEVAAKLILHGLPPDETRDVLAVLGLDVIPFDTELAYITGQLAAQTRSFGLSIGDRACLALALKTNATAVTADRVWGKINGKFQIKCIR